MPVNKTEDSNQQGMLVNQTTKDNNRGGTPAEKMPDSDVTKDTDRRGTPDEGMPNKRTMVNTTPDPLGRSDDGTSVDSMADNIKGMTGDYFDDSHPRWL